MLTAGDILKKARVEKNLTLDEIEREIKTRKKFLQAIENNQWQHFSSRIYLEGIIKNYSILLGIDPKKTLAYFARDYEKKEEIKFKKRLVDIYFTSTTKKLISYGIFLIFFIFIGYFAYQLNLYFRPPKIEIISPKNEKIKRESLVKIIGQTEPESQITIAGQRVYPDNKGVFEFSYPVKKGKNLIIIEVIGANGRKTIFKKEVFKLD